MRKSVICQIRIKIHKGTGLLPWVKPKPHPFASWIRLWRRSLAKGGVLAAPLVYLNVHYSTILYK